MEGLEQYWHIFWGAIITGVVSLLCSWVRELKRRYDREQEEKEKLLTMLADGLKDLKIWQKKIDEDCAKRNKAIEDLNNHLEAIRLGGLSIMRDRMYQGCKHFISLGYIPAIEKAHLMDMHRCYKMWGGNGLIDIVFKEMMALPVVDGDSDSASVYGAFDKANYNKESKIVHENGNFALPEDSITVKTIGGENYGKY